MPFLKRAYKHLNDAISWLKKPRDYELLQKFIIGTVLFVLFAPLFLLALLVVYNLLFEVVQFEVWESILKFLELEVNTVEPSFGFAALLAAILSAPFVIWRTWVAHQDYRVKEQGHITDRINKAVEGLGAEKTVKQLAEDGTTKEFTEPNLEVRMGAIYALERIAKDSLRDHIQIMEILSAYIRQNAVKPLHVNLKLRLDIQIALTVIGRRAHSQIKLERKRKYVLDLSNINLDNVVLKGLNFDRANFEHSSFRDSNLSLGSFIKASFYQVDFEKAQLYKAKFNGAILFHTNFKATLLPYADFKNAEIGQANFSDNSQVDGVDFTEFKRFKYVKMQGIDLSHGVKIESEQLKQIFADASVVLAEKLSPVNHWPKVKLGNDFEKEYKKWLKDPKNYTPPKP